MRLLKYALIALICIAAPLPAQEDEDEGGFLVNLLQENLSGENRYIKVSGLEGALSARATIRQLTVSDDEGVWLTISDAVLDWNRLALVRGRFSVNSLSAGEINLARNPTPTATSDDLPAPEASPFQVPELPVAVEIGELRVDKFILGEPVIGRAAELSIGGSVSLADGTLDTKLAIARLDRATDELKLIAGFENATSLISLDLGFTEAEGGLVSEILDVPDRPSMSLTARGQGPVTDFTADIALASNETERLHGQIRLFGLSDAGSDATASPGIGFEADLGGDISPLLAGEYKDFFGADLQLNLAGRSNPDGRLTVQNLDLNSNALIMNATLDIAGGGKIEKLLMQGRIAPPDGTEVVLPIGEPRTAVSSAVISARLEADKDNSWDLRLSIDGLNRPNMTMTRAEVNADGTLDQQDGMRFTGTLDTTLRGLTFADGALNDAIGPLVRLNGDFEAVNETALKLSKFELAGDDYSATVDAEIDGLDSGFRIEGRAGVQASDLARFSAIAGQEISGAISGTLAGVGSPLGGTFDFDLNATAQDLTVGIEQVDALIAGTTTLALLAERSEKGLDIRAFRLDGTALKADASGAVRSGSTDLDFNARLDDLARIVPQMPGPLTLKGDVSQTSSELSGMVRLDGPDMSFANLNGSLAKNGAIDLSYAATLNGVERFLPQFPGTASAEGTASYDGKNWAVVSNATGPAGIIADVSGSFDDAKQIALDVRLAEPSGGPVSELLKIPDRPSLTLTAKGDGPITGFRADVSLASDGTQRLAGQVRLSSVPASESGAGAGAGAGAAASSGIGFDAELAGDVAPLLATEYREFFGNDTRFNLNGRSEPDGRVAVEKFDVISNALILNGALDIAATGLVERALLQGRISPPDSSEVTLPLPGPRTSVKSAMVTARFETDQNNAWNVRLGLDGLVRPDINLSRAEIDASGKLDQLDNMHLTGTVAAVARGIVLADSALAQAIGTQIRLRSDFEVTDKQKLTLGDFALNGVDYDATLNAVFDGLDSDTHVHGRADVKAGNLSRFSGLAGRPVGGTVSASLTGNAALSGESFDLDLAVQALDLTSGMAKADVLTAGETTLNLSAARGVNGLEIKTFDLNGTALTADASGILRKGNTSLEFSARLDDLARLVPEAPGPLTLKGDVSQDGDTVIGTVRLDGPTESFADLKGTLTPDGTVKLDYDALLARAERFMPEFPGQISAQGTAERSGNVWSIASNAKGPAGIAADIAGSIDQVSLESDLTAKGQVQLAAVNRFITPNSVRGVANFDLALKGKPSLEALSGKITTANTSVAIPAVVQTIDKLDANIALSSGRADLSATAGLRAGGQVRITGPVSLTAPYDASIIADIQQLILTDNVTFDSSANGRLAYSGALAGNGSVTGEILFGETNININAMSGSLGAAPIPSMTHIGESGGVYATRERAGLVETSKTGTGPDIGLNVRLSALNKVFVRGRGLQAELGGDILIRGSTAQVAPAGQIALIRGNLDILGRRLKLSKGLVTLQGKLEPYMEFEATTSTSDGVATLEIAGPMTAPKVTVYSDPERPSEEALAMLVFGNQFSELSPLKIAQLAASLAQLSGSGGGATEKARKGLGVDTLDIGTDDDGKGQFGAGKYIAEGVYTDFSVNTQGDSELNLNLDVTKNLTLKGTVDNTGDTALGIFFERDY